MTIQFLHDARSLSPYTVMTNYDIETINTPPWWSGIIALLTISALLIIHLLSK